MLRYYQPYRVIFYISVKEAQLRMAFFGRKGMQIGKNLSNIMHQTCFFTGFVIKAHEFHIPWTVTCIPVSELTDIHFLKPGKVPVQLSIKVFPVAFP